MLQTVWNYKELRNALSKDGWNKSHFQVKVFEERELLWRQGSYWTIHLSITHTHIHSLPLITPGAVVAGMIIISRFCQIPLPVL